MFVTLKCFWQNVIKTYFSFIKTYKIDLKIHSIIFQKRDDGSDICFIGKSVI